MSTSIKQKEAIHVFLVALVLAYFAILLSAQAAQPPDIQNVNEFNTPFQRTFSIEIKHGENRGQADIETPFEKTLVVEFVSMRGNFPAGEHPIDLKVTGEGGGVVEAHLLWNFQASANDRDFFIASQQIRLYENPKRTRGLSVFVTRDVAVGDASISGSVIGYIVNTP